VLESAEHNYAYDENSGLSAKVTYSVAMRDYERLKLMLVEQI